MIAGSISGSNGVCYDNSPATSCLLDAPYGISLDSSANLLIVNNNNDQILKVDAVTNLVTVLAGGFAGSTGSPSGYTGDWITAKYATINSATDVCADREGNVYIAELGSHRIRKISLNNGAISTVAGISSANGGISTDGSFASSVYIKQPFGVRVDITGNVYFSENGNNKVRRVNKLSGILQTLAGTGTAGSLGDGSAATSATLLNPTFVDIDTKGDVYMVHEVSATVAIVRKVSMGTRIISTVYLHV